MSFPAGSRLGPYEIVAPLGAGGMGEVYRARDARLDRDVAIKVLPASFAEDADRRARFEREAKAIAALSHPNILAIHDIGASPAPDDGSGRHRTFLYAVTELLAGETLRERLRHGPLPVRKAIEIAVQIARGLAAAHDRGLVHRDLKPENVFLLADGQVKILDFGLAKSAASPAHDATATATAMTDPGTVMGTVGYMAPEQVRGQATDARTDLFAFGAVLYEMLSGQRAFQRETAAETLTAILRDDPPELTAARAHLPPALDRIVRHCLEKQPAERFQTARDVAFALEAFSGSGATTSANVAAAAAPRRALAPALVGVALAIAGGAAGFGLAAWLRPARAQTPITFEARTWDPQWITNMRFAPDGQTILYSAAASGNSPTLFVLRQGALIAQPLGQPGTHLLSVSRSGELAVLTNARFIGHRLFEGTLTRMTLDGGARAFMEKVREADWSPDSTTMAIVRDLGDKDQLEYPIDTKLYETAGYVSDLRVSPDGTRVAFLDHPAKYDDRGWVKVVDRRGVVKAIAGEFWGAEGLAWTPDGKTVYFSAAVGGFAYPPYAVNVDGEPKLRALFPSFMSTEMMDVAADGRVLVNFVDTRVSVRILRAGESSERELPWLDLPIGAALSADGQWLLFTDESSSAGMNYAVAWRKTDGSPPVRLGEGNAVLLSPDAKWAIGRVPSPAPAHFMAYPTGAGEAVRLDFSPVAQARPVSFFPDGRLVFCGEEPNHHPRCYARALTGGTATPITPEGISAGSVAPDGHTLGVLTAAGVMQLMDTAGGPARTIPGDHTTDQFVGWSADSRSVFVVVNGTVPAQLDRLDLATGARTHVRDLMPPDRAGVIQVRVSSVSHDGQSYVYDYERSMTKAVVVSGAK